MSSGNGSIAVIIHELTNFKDSSWFKPEQEHWLICRWLIWMCSENDKLQWPRSNPPCCALTGPEITIYCQRCLDTVRNPDQRDASLVVCLAFSRLETPSYLVHVSIGATSNPLDELKVLLRVPPLDFSTRPGKYIHGGSFASSGSNLLESVCGSWIQSEHRDSVDPSASSIGWNRLTKI